MGDIINILLIHTDTELIRSISQGLSQIDGSSFVVQIMPSLMDAVDCLRQQDIDVVLLDFSLFTREDDKPLTLLRTQFPHIILVALQESSGLNTNRLGIQDYIIKSDLSPRLLELTLHYAIERKRSQKTLHTTQSRLQFIIESIQDFAIFSTDLNGRINFWNSGAEHVFGYSEAEIIGQSFELLFTPEDQAQGIPAKELQEAMQKGLALDERWHVKKGGFPFYASGMIRPIYDDMDNLIGFTKVARDLTERQLANEQRDILLQRALEARTEAEQTNTLKEEFLALIAHEIRTPLASIVGFASMMTSKTMTWPRESMVEYAAIIEEEAQRMSNLIEQLTDHARQQTGTLKIDFDVTSLDIILRSALPQLNALTTQHHLFIDIPSDLPNLYADPQRISQVLTNLVGNAARYSQPQTQITIHAQYQAHEVQVDVIDEGRGIPAEERENVFKPFHQVNRSSTKGLGLGLALCKDLVERHKGKIWIQDYEGPGTIIAFTLPILEYND